MAERIKEVGGVRIDMHNGFPTVFYNGEHRLALAVTEGFGPEYITVMTRGAGEKEVKVQIMGFEDFLNVVHHATDIIGEIEEEDGE